MGEWQGGMMMHEESGLDDGKSEGGMCVAGTGELK